VCPVCRNEHSLFTKKQKANVRLMLLAQTNDWTKIVDGNLRHLVIMAPSGKNNHFVPALHPIGLWKPGHNKQWNLRFDLERIL